MTKYLVLLCDGMSDYPTPELGLRTPMMEARKPNMNALALHGQVGLVKTVPDSLKPGSDVANLSVMGYDPLEFYSGRSPLEAANIGAPMTENDLAIRCNLVTLSDEPDYNQKTMLDYCAGDISTQEAAQIINSLKHVFDNDQFTLYPGVSYRHCLIWKNQNAQIGECTPPHDISNQVIGTFLPQNQEAQPLLHMMRESCRLLKEHPVNLARVAKGLHPANAVWLWGAGTKKPLPSFYDRFGLHAAVISAVDLIKGIGRLTGMQVPNVEGATGYIDTNFANKARAAADALQNGCDLAYIHIEAPDECGHRFEVKNKVRSIELIDELVLGPMLNALKKYDHYRILILPDHPTPLALGRHVSDPVPFILYDNLAKPSGGAEGFDEQTAAETGLFIEDGCNMMRRFTQNQTI